MLDIDLTKLDIALTKNNLLGMKAMVATLPDVSGSMVNEYVSGSMYKLMRLLFPVAVRFDDDAALEVVAFNHYDHTLDEITSDTFDDRLEQLKLLAKDCGGTEMSRPINALVRMWFKAKSKNKLMGLFSAGKTVYEKKKIPGIALLLTDGENSPRDNDRLTDILRESSRYPLYIIVMDVSNSAKNKTLFVGDNVHYISAASVKDLAQDDIYDLLITEKMTAFFKKHDAACSA